MSHDADEAAVEVTPEEYAFYLEHKDRLMRVLSDHGFMYFVERSMHGFGGLYNQVCAQYAVESRSLAPRRDDCRLSAYCLHMLLHMCVVAV